MGGEFRGATGAEAGRFDCGYSRGARRRGRPGAGAIVLCVALLTCSVAAAAPARAARSISEFFVGRLVADGAFTDLRAGLRRGVHVDIHGSRQSGVFLVTTDTSFSDGERTHKVWRFTADGPGRYLGSRPDLVGPARVEIKGNEASLNYRAHVPIKLGGSVALDFAERFIIRNDGVIENTMQVYWLSFHVGEAHLRIRRL